MSKDLLHQLDWEKAHPSNEEINTSKGEYAIWTWSCGMGWSSQHRGLTLKEARQIKTRYASTLVSAKIILEVE